MEHNPRLHRILLALAVWVASYGAALLNERLLLSRLSSALAPVASVVLWIVQALAFLLLAYLLAEPGSMESRLKWTARLWAPCTVFTWLLVLLLFVLGKISAASSGALVIAFAAAALIWSDVTTRFSVGLAGALALFAFLCTAGPIFAAVIVPIACITMIGAGFYTRPLPTDEEPGED